MDSGTTIGTLVVKLTSDITGLQLNMGQANATFDTVTTKSSTLSKAMGLIGPAVGAGIGLAFGAALQSGQQLDAATQKLAADTGLSGDALKAQSNAIDNLYKNNLQSMSQIEASMAEVISGFKLSGQAADDLTQKFLSFETATGQGSDAVKALKEVTDAWHLSASDESTIMDQLVASHQQYGSSVVENEDALQKMAPALQAMGASEKDGIDLLNLFESAGMDSSKAVTALNHAVKDLQPGQNINDLITQITSITDPTQRAQAAMDIFGAKGGVALANALQPGITSLDQFATSADTTNGASDRAAQAIEDDWGNRATLAIHQVTGALASVGEQFGPLLSAAAIAGPGITKGVMAGLGGLAGAIVPKIAEQLGLTVPAWMAGGEAEGAAAGTAAVEAEAGAITAGGAAIDAAVGADIVGAEAVAGTGGLALGAVVVAGLLAAFLANAPSHKATLVGALIPDKSDFDAALGPGGFELPIKVASTGPDSLAGQILVADQAGVSQFDTDREMLSQAALNGYSGTIDAVATVVNDSTAALQTGMNTQETAIRAKLQTIIDDQVTDITSARSKLAGAWTAALKESTDAQTLAYRQDADLADIADTNKALADKATYDKLSKQQQDALHEQLITQQAAYVSLVEEGTQYGTDAQKKAALAALLQSQAMKDGLSSIDPDTVKMWQQVQLDTQTALDNLKTAASQGGSGAANALNGGWNNAMQGDSWEIPTVTTNGTNVNIRGSMTQLAAGTPYVPRDMLAFLHQGEAVIPANQNRGAGQGALTVNIYNPTAEPASNSLQHELLLLAHVGYLGG